MNNQFKVAHMDTDFTLDEFLLTGEFYAKKVFAEEKDFVHPFCTLLLKDGSSILAFLDFSSDEIKSKCMQAIRHLARMSGAIAYIGIYEAYVSKALLTDAATLNTTLDGLKIKVEMQSEREDSFIMIQEWKKDGKVDSHMTTWAIEQTPQGRKLIKRNDGHPKKIEGRMFGVIQ